MRLALVRAFRLIKFFAVVPNLEAMPLKVSLATTVYVVVGVGAGVPEESLKT